MNTLAPKFAVGDKVMHGNEYGLVIGTELTDDLDWDFRVLFFGTQDPSRKHLCNVKTYVLRYYDTSLTFGWT